MSPEVRAALEASIKHWEENVAATDTPDCVHEDFGECPVFARTGEDQCGISPWPGALRAHARWARGEATKDEWQAAAQAELDFLKSLLPPRP